MDDLLVGICAIVFILTLLVVATLITVLIELVAELFK